MLKDAKHIFKLDPTKEISDEDMEKIAETGTDLIFVCCTEDETEDNLMYAMSRIRLFSKSVALEMNNRDAVMPGFDHYFIPSVFNTSNIKWQHGLMVEALEEYSHLIDYEDISMLPYI